LKPVAVSVAAPSAGRHRSASQICPAELALYSLTGRANSPFHAEPAQRCVVIYLATTAFDDAFRLFTIVNDRGKQLRRIDILKAINIAPEVVTKDTVRNRVAQQWEQIEKELSKVVPIVKTIFCFE
jgi:hypothetical protein